MKKLIIAFVALFTVTLSTSAMGYEQAREQALFLTDKMAYELNLTEEQYEAAYEVNLDYLMGVNSYDDVYGTYWTRRNLDLSYILLDWQYQAFVNATYFYRPLWWEGGYWHFGIYARYPHRDYFYFGRPHFYAVYRGGHSWHHNGGRSWYNGRNFAGPGPQNGRQNGMRDGFQRGDYRGGYDNNRNRSFGNGQRPGTQNRNYGQGTQRQGTQQRGSFGQGTQRTTTQQRPSTQQRTQGQGSFGGAQRNGQTRQSSTRTTVTRTQQSGTTFGGAQRSTSQPRQSFSPSRSAGTMQQRSASAPSRSTGSFGGGSRSGGSSHSTAGGGRSGGGSFGGHR